MTASGHPSGGPDIDRLCIARGGQTGIMRVCSPALYPGSAVVSNFLAGCRISLRNFSPLALAVSAGLYDYLEME